MPPGPQPRVPPLPRPQTPAPIAEPPQKTLREALGEQPFMNLVTVMRILFSSCPALNHNLLSVEGERIAYGGKDVASPSGDSITIPLAAFGDEAELYRCIRPHAASGVLPGSPVEELDAAKGGRFIRVGPEGIGIRCPKRPGPAPVARTAGVSAAVSAIELADAGLVGRVKVCEKTGESRIYFSDLGWNSDKFRKCGAFLKAIGVEASEGRLAFISGCNEVFISCGESLVSLCGAKERGGKALVSIFCGKQGL